MQNFPLFKKEHFGNNKSDDELFKSNLVWSDNLVLKLQTNNSSNNIVEIPLSFYPIAKNIRFVSSYMTINIINGKTSEISNKSRVGEKEFWENKLNRGNWYPWLWCRKRLNYDNVSNKDGWNYYFKSLIRNSNNFKKEKSIEPEVKYKVFFLYLSCLNYTFNFDNIYEKYINEHIKDMNWNKYENILAVQIRRGEICTKDCSKSYRECFNIETYIKNIEHMMENSVNKYDAIYISTDSDEEIDKIKKIKPEWNLIYLSIDRTKFYRMEDSVVKKENEDYYKTTDLEDFCRMNPENIPFVVDSALLDLYFISRSNAYISTIENSEFSRLGWYLQITHNKKLTPYINLNSNNIDMSKKDILLLL